jgi:hypothetical protein
METMTDNKELEQMKGQLGVLKDKLEKESLVNDRIMRRIMRKRVKTIKRYVDMTYVLILISIPYCTWVFKSLLGVSWAFVVVTDLFMVVALIYEYQAHKEVTAKGLLDESLLDVSRKVQRMKKMNAQWLLFGIPFGILWLLWIILDIPEDNDYIINVMFIIIGAIVGAFVGITFYRKRQRIAKDILSQIDELTKE